LLLRLIYDLLHQYDPTGTDPDPDRQRITALVDGVEIWINPLANPDGTYYASDASPSGAISYLTDTAGASAWVDANRNFPDPVQGDHPDGNAWWTETQAMMSFAGAHHFALAANLHGSAEVVSYPWDSRAALLRTTPGIVSWVAPMLLPRPRLVGYMDDLDDGITTAGPVTGLPGRQDYMNYWLGW
jgi:hypothetical protein